jgi:hypothetical protein
MSPSLPKSKTLSPHLSISLSRPLSIENLLILVYEKNRFGCVCDYGRLIAIKTISWKQQVCKAKSSKQNHPETVIDM